MSFSTHASMPHEQPINTYHISTHLASADTSSCMVKNCKIIYLTHMILILNSVFIIVFYPSSWTKLDHNCIYFEEFLNQLNLLYKYRMGIYASVIDKKIIGSANYSILNFMFHPRYLCNISLCFMLSVIFFYNF
jgi:hypothetical protein